METIDFGDFNLNDTGAVKAPPPEPQAVKITTRKADASLVQKELTSKKKSEPEIQKHQELTLMLSRYGTSSRFGDYLKSLSFELTPAKLTEKAEGRETRGTVGTGEDIRGEQDRE